MEPKARSGMTSYVANKNVKQDGVGLNALHHGFSDLKLPAAQPSIRLANKHTSNGNLKNYDRADRDRSGEHKRHDDTDTSLADMTSNSASAKQGKVPGNGRQDINLRDRYDEDDDDNLELNDDGGEGVEDIMSEDDAQPAVQETATDPEQAQRVGQGIFQTHEASGERLQGDALHCVSGDSYPETTSGQPSIADADLALDAGIKPQPVSTKLPERGVVSHFKFSKLPANVYGPASGPNPRVSPNAIPRTPKFQYCDARVGNPPTRPGQAQHKQQYSMTRTHVQHNAPLSDSQATHVRLPAEREQGISITAVTKHPPQHRRQAQSEHQLNHLQDQQYQDPVAHFAQLPETHAEPAQPDKMREHIQPSVKEPTQYAPEQDLDFEPTTLLSMDFAEVRAQSFDKHPKPLGHRYLPRLPAENSLEMNMEVVAKLEPHAKAEFFAQLNIDEWENAGDWFLERFRHIVHQMTTARQERRAMARQFEDEIERRHKAVKMKREDTDQALRQMRKSGADLLFQGTPTKHKRAKVPSG